MPRKRRPLFSLLLLCLSPVLIGCGTTVGFHNTRARNGIDFGPPLALHVCYLHEKDVSLEQVGWLHNAWKKELRLYEIRLVNSSVIEVTRPGFTGGSVLNHLLALPLNAPCDRIVYLAGRTTGDLLYELGSIVLMLFTGLKIELYGVVETRTHTRGFVKAKYTGLIQLLATSPKRTLIHEGYHLLGCPHALSLKGCYAIIRELKSSLSLHPDSDFFPGVTRESEPILSREEVNALLLSQRTSSNEK